MSVDAALINRPMLEKDVAWALAHEATAGMRRFVGECAKKDVPFWNGILRNNTFNAAGNHFKTLNWYRLWEYASCYDFLVKPHPPGAHFLDLGGAGCYFSFYLAFLGYRVTIVDIDPYMVDVTSAMAKKLGLESRLNCIRRDFIADGGKDLKIDGAYSISVVEHIPQEGRRAILRQMRQALPKGGHAFLTFDYGDFVSDYIDSVHSLADFSADVETAGFELDPNRFTPEMEDLKVKPYASKFYAVYDDMGSFAHTDPLADQLRFVFKSIALRLGYIQAKDAIKKIIGRKAPDYNFCRLLAKAV